MNKLFGRKLSSFLVFLFTLLFFIANCTSNVNNTVKQNDVKSFLKDKNSFSVKKSEPKNNEIFAVDSKGNKIQIKKESVPKGQKFSEPKHQSGAFKVKADEAIYSLGLSLSNMILGSDTPYPGITMTVTTEPQNNIIEEPVTIEFVQQNPAACYLHRVWFTGSIYDSPYPGNANEFGIEYWDPNYTPNGNYLVRAYLTNRPNITSPSYNVVLDHKRQVTLSLSGGQNPFNPALGQYPEFRIDTISGDYIGLLVRKDGVSEIIVDCPDQLTTGANIAWYWNPYLQNGTYEVKAVLIEDWSYSSSVFVEVYNPDNVPNPTPTPTSSPTATSSPTPSPTPSSPCDCNSTFKVMANSCKKQPCPSPTPTSNPSSPPKEPRDPIYPPKSGEGDPNTSSDGDENCPSTDSNNPTTSGSKSSVTTVAVYDFDDKSGNPDISIVLRPNNPNVVTDTNFFASDRDKYGNTVTPSEKLSKMGSQVKITATDKNGNQIGGENLFKGDGNPSTPIFRKDEKGNGIENSGIITFQAKDDRLNNAKLSDAANDKKDPYEKKAIEDLNKNTTDNNKSSIKNNKTNSSISTNGESQASNIKNCCIDKGKNIELPVLAANLDGVYDSLKTGETANLKIQITTDDGRTSTINLKLTKTESGKGNWTVSCGGGNK